MEFSDFETTLRGMAKRVKYERLNNYYSVQHMYANPQNYIEDFSYFAYIVENRPDVFTPELVAQGKELVRHCKEHFSQQKDGKRFLTEFEEKIKQYPVIWAMNGLRDEAIDELTIINENHGSGNIARGITSAPSYALKLLTEIEAAMDICSTPDQQKPRKQLEQVRDYILSYYTERATVKEATNLLFDYETSFKPENENLPEKTRQTINALCQTAREGNGDDQRAAAIHERLQHFTSAHEAAKYIAAQNLPELIELEEKFFLTEMSNPSDFLFNGLVSPRNIVAYQYAAEKTLQRINSRSPQETDMALRKALADIDIFLTEIAIPDAKLREESMAFNSRSFSDVITDEKKWLENVTVISAVAKYLPNGDILKDAALKNLYIGDKHAVLIQSIIILAEQAGKGDEFAADCLKAKQWCTQQFSHAPLPSLATGIVKIEARLAEEGKNVLSEPAKNALRDTINDVLAVHEKYNRHYTHRSPEPQRLILAERARKAISRLPQTKGLADLRSYFNEMEEEQLNHLDKLPLEDIRIEENYLVKKYKDYPTLGRHYALLKHISEHDDAHAADAVDVLAYLDNYYRNPHKIGSVIDTHAYKFRTLWEEVKTLGAQTEERFLNALDGNLQEAAFFVDASSGLAPEIQDYIFTHVANQGEEALAEMRHYLLYPTNTPLHAVQALQPYQNVPTANLKSLLFSVESEPEAVMWDAAHWLCKAQRAIEFAPASDRSRMKNAVGEIHTFLSETYASKGLDLDGLQEQMQQALEAAYTFNGNNSVLSGLCADSPNIIKTPENTNLSHDVSPEICALYKAQLETAIKAFTGQQKNVAQEMLPFLVKALEHAKMTDTVAKSQSILSAMQDCLPRIKTDQEHIISDESTFLSYLEAGGSGAASIMAEVENAIDEHNEKNRTSMTERVTLIRLQGLIEKWVDASNNRTRYEDGLLERKAGLSFEKLVNENTLPELTALIEQSRNKYVEKIDAMFLMSSFLHKDQHFKEKLWVVLDNAQNMEGSPLPKATQRALQTIKNYLSASFDQANAYAREEGLPNYTPPEEVIKNIQQRRGQGLGR